MNHEEDPIGAFLAGDTFAVVGASTNRQKYGNKVLRCYLQNDRSAYPINPRADEIEVLIRSQVNKGGFWTVMLFVLLASIAFLGQIKPF